MASARLERRQVQERKGKRDEETSVQKCGGDEQSGKGEYVGGGKQILDWGVPTDSPGKETTEEKRGGEWDTNRIKNRMGGGEQNGRSKKKRGLKGSGWRGGG